MSILRRWASGSSLRDRGRAISFSMRTLGATGRSSGAGRVVKAEEVSPNHGWRHTFKTKGRDAAIEDSVLDVICGHAPKSVGGAYGSVTLAGQRAALARFPRFKV